MAIIYGNTTDNKNYAVWLDWSSVKYDSELKSVVTATIKMKRLTSGYMTWDGYGNTWASITCDGVESKKTGITYKVNGIATITLHTATFTIYHQNGVNRVVNISGAFGNTQINPSSGSVDSSEIELGTINNSTNCGAPTKFIIKSNSSGSTDVYTNSIKLEWSGATNGTANAIYRYWADYHASTDNSTWGGWQGGFNVYTAEGSASSVQTPDVSRGTYIQYRVRAEGNAGENFYSDFKLSNSIQYEKYTAPTNPNSFTLDKTDLYESNLKLSWKSAGSGANNPIKSYTIQYRYAISTTGTWTSWAEIAVSPINSSATSGSITFDGTIIPRGNYVQFRIKTNGTQSGYVSDGYKQSETIRRNSAPNSPTNFKVSPNTYKLGNTLKFTWDKAADLDNNVSSYNIEYDTSTDISGTTWNNNWTDLVSTTNLTYSFTPVLSLIADGYWVRFRIRAEDNSSVGSDWSIPILVQRKEDILYLIYSNNQFVQVDLSLYTSGAWIALDLNYYTGGLWVY